MNLTYVVLCSGCCEKYVGETGGQLKHRLHIYRQHIKQPEYQQMSCKSISEYANLKLFLSWKSMKIINYWDNLMKPVS